MSNTPPEFTGFDPAKVATLTLAQHFVLGEIIIDGAKHLDEEGWPDRYRQALLALKELKLFEDVTGLQRRLVTEKGKRWYKNARVVPD